MKEDYRVFSQYVQNSRPANVLMAGISYCDATYRVSRSDYDSYVIEHTVDGQGVLETEGEHHELHAGDTYFLYKGVPHRYYCKENSWTKIWVVLQGELVESLFDIYLKQRPAVLRGCDIQEDMMHIFELSQNDGLSYEAMVDQIILTVHRILILLQKQLLPPAKEHTLGEAVKQYLDHNLYKPLVLDVLAEEMHYSKNHIINVFRDAYDCTPYAYYEKRRMQIAADLLNGSSQSVSDISVKLRFESPEYFSKCFKRHYGITPGRFRKRR